MQNYANQVMLGIEKGEQIAEYINRAKFAIITSDISQAEDLFPDIFYPEEIPASQANLDALSGKSSEFVDDPGETMTPERMKAILDQFG